MTDIVPTIKNLDLAVTVEQRGEDTWAAARAIQDALFEVAGGEFPRRILIVDDETGRVGLHTPEGAA